MSDCLWRLPATCLYCGGDLTHVNGTSSPTLAVSIVQCVPCHREFEVTARLLECRRTPRVQKGRRAA